MDYCKALIYLALLSISSLSVINANKHSQYLQRNISNQIVQEKESIQIALGDYFQGSLLDY